MKKINKILVANRGEIAIRVFKTAKKMGIKTVAVYSTVDRNAPHVQMADEAVLIGEAPSSESYLKYDTIIEVAKKCQVDAIHPGYGFLSENALFSQKVADEGLIFIGPKPHAIKTMGDKLAAKDAVKNYDIPMVPGVDEPITDVTKAIEVAKEIGFPVKRHFADLLLSARSPPCSTYSFNRSLAPFAGFFSSFEYLSKTSLIC